MQMRLAEILAVLEPCLVRCLGEGDPQVRGMAYDSRQVEPGNLFACFVGETSDGHQYAAKAAESGARLVLCEREIEGLAVPQIIVRNTLKALMLLAHAWRKQCQAKVIGLTGTCGKTTAKEMLAAILALHGKTAKSFVNHNNQLGMAHGILNTEGDEQYWVFEAGISNPHDMDELGSMLLPDYALILNIGPGHTEGLGDMGVAWHKTRLLTHLSEGGVGIVSADYPELVWKAMGTHISPLVFFSAQAGAIGGKNDCANFCQYLGENEAGQGRYRLVLEGSESTVLCPLAASYAAENICAVALTCHLLGLPLATIQAGLANFENPPQRFRRRKLGRHLVIDDTYNANPLSMQRMLMAAHALGKPLVCLLGEMRELGREAEACHRELGRQLAALAPSLIFWKGGHGADLKQGLTSAGYSGPLLMLDGSVDVARSLADFLQKADKRDGITLLAKGSRANALEQELALAEEVLQGEQHVL
ncbi:MAG: UDP-N-acetylmuramoyl-tripeptide--D-alanyl-D-alanine ligase [Desulfovibrio sp.]|nr:UDP-N-acetylmuramoyl-tripeptide--D-alanyl-D-alanine ligase [Desulfovibrio sp.]